MTALPGNSMASRAAATDFPLPGSPITKTFRFQIISSPHPIREDTVVSPFLSPSAARSHRVWHWPIVQPSCRTAPVRPPCVLLASEVADDSRSVLACAFPPQPSARVRFSRVLLVHVPVLHALPRVRVA